MFWEFFHPFVTWLGNTGLGLWMGRSVERIAWLFIFHTVGLALFIGAVVVLNLRIFGLALQRQSVADLAREMEPLTVVGLIVTLISGASIFTGGAEAYYMGSWFRTKMLFLFLALVFHFAVFRTVIRADEGHLNPLLARLAGGVTLLLWFGVGISGRAIAFF